MVWVYEGHLGSLYATYNQQDFDDLYCDECGDYDWEVGGFETPEEFLSSYANEIGTDKNSGGWYLEYVMENVLDYFDEEISMEKALEIVLANQEDEMDKE